MCNQNEIVKAYKSIVLKTKLYTGKVNIYVIDLSHNDVKREKFDVTRNLIGL